MNSKKLQVKMPTSKKMVNNGVITPVATKNDKDTFSQDFINSNFRIGFEFEFMTKMDDKDLVKSLADALGKKIIIPIEITKLNTRAIPNHSEFTPSDKEFKLERDFSGGVDMRELITGPLVYKEAIPILRKFLKWLSEYGYTTKKTSVHINLSIINPLNMNLKNTIQNLNRTKFCLEFDEDYVYERFPNRKNNVYARSIKTFYPTFTHTSTNNIHPNNFLTPNTKYFGVNFLKQEKNYLEFRYLGGEGYEKKFKSINECITHFISSLYECLNNPSLTKRNIEDFEKIVKPISEFSEAISNFERFIFTFPEILLLVDLDYDVQKVKSFFGSIFQNVLNDFVSNAGFRSGILNYDSEYGIIQIKDANLVNIRKNDKTEYFNCKIDGALTGHNTFVECEIKNGIFNDCEFYNTKVTGCKINSFKSNVTSVFDDCYIENKKQDYSGKFLNSIIRYDLPNSASIIKNCLFVAELLEKLEKKQVKKDIENPEDLYKEFKRS